MDNLRSLLLHSAAVHANRTALWVDENAVTYRDLIACGEDIAGALPDDKRRTAVVADRRFWAYAGIVGAVLAGHAYVPLNPRHPLERLQTVLRSANVGAIVLDEANLAKYRPLLEMAPAATIIVPDAEQLPDWIVLLPHHNFLSASDLSVKRAAPTISGEDGAYLLFTSGSTGTPKGVMVSQQNVMAYLQTMIAHCDMRPEDRTSQLFDLTFDLSVHDLFVTWGSGAALYCPSETGRKAPRQFIRRHGLSCWFSTPATVAFMSRLRMLMGNDFPSLRLSLFCGEALPRRLVEAWKTAAPRSIIENLYGPTEATIAITAYRVDRLEDDIVPIGQALPGQQAEVFCDGMPMPLGASGELWVSGSQVTKGYWQRPDLTAERFVSYGSRYWYRTGDRAIRQADGLRFLGRLDRQVKVLGHRIELQEVEAALRQAAACDSVAALAWPVDADGLAQGIVALVASESRPDADIVAACRAILAPYMLPTRLIRVAEWPLNTNGKTDYLALTQTYLRGA
jgi:amino acid adenylation domain-containing protein